MPLNEEQQKVIDEINVGITGLRDQQKILEDAGVSKETLLAEQKALIENITKKVDEIEVGQIKIAERIVDNKDEKSEEHKAFMSWMRTGEPSPELRNADTFKKGEVKAPEGKVMTISDATTGGYLASPEISNELLKNVVEYSPIREVAKVRTTSKQSVKIRKRTGVFAAQWSGELGPKTETTGLTYGLEEVPNHELYALVDISNWDLEDSDFNLEAELNAEFAEQFGVAEGTGFVSGNAVKKPEGILTNASVDHIASGDANLLLADSFKTLYFAPKSVYAKTSRWVMNRATMLAASLLKTGTGVYLLTQLTGAPGWNIMGSQVLEAVDMPDVAAGTFPVLFGDFRKGYVIVDRIAIAILRDPFTQAASGAVRFHARKRVGGQVVMAEAIWKLEIALS